MENEVKETKKGIGALGVILIVLLCVGITAPSAWYLGKKMGEKDNQQQVDNNKNNNDQNKTNNNANNTNNTKSDDVKEVLFSHSNAYGNDVIVELTEDGKVLVTIKGDRFDGKKELIKEEVFNNVNKTYEVHAGQSDICEGNFKLMFIMNDSTISYLDMDQLVCGDDVVTAKNVANLKDIVEITEKITPGPCSDDIDWCEPDKHSVYAIDKSSKKTDITDFLIPKINYRLE